MVEGLRAKPQDKRGNGKTEQNGKGGGEKGCKGGRIMQSYYLE